MIFTREDIYDMILGSGALTYPWYEAAIEIMAPHDEDPWLVSLMMENPEDDDTIEIKVTYPAVFTAAVRMTDDTELSKDGSSAILGVSQEARRQAAFLVNDDEDMDFDANTADELIQVVAYGQVIFC
jgi:hypothetical protein